MSIGFLAGGHDWPPQEHTMKIKTSLTKDHVDKILTAAACYSEIWLSMRALPDESSAMMECVEEARALNVLITTLRNDMGGKG